METCRYKHERYIESLFCPCNRVENESRQKNTAAEGKAVKEEDPYGGSTDENTDAEAEEDHPIPELPGMSLCSVSSCLFFFLSVPVTGKVLSSSSDIANTDRK